MQGIPISSQQVMRVALMFGALIVAFGILSAIAGWPDKQSWGTILVLSAVIAALPLLGPLLEFIKDSGAVIDIRGVKLDFSTAAADDARVERANFEDRPGIQVNDSNATSIAEAAETAQASPVVVVDLGTGHSWYPTRLFALAAAADMLGGARAIVIQAQQGGVSGKFIGWIIPKDAVRAFYNRDPRYRQAYADARTILFHLRLSGGDDTYVFPQRLVANAKGLRRAYRESGDLALVPALISCMQTPLPPLPGIPAMAPLENVQAPEWLSRDDAERTLDPWLIRDHIREDMPDAEKRAIIARAAHEYLATTADTNAYRGMICVTSAVRRQVFSTTAKARSTIKTDARG
jgi:hypothetical protein